MYDISSMIRVSQSVKARGRDPRVCKAARAQLLRVNVRVGKDELTAYSLSRPGLRLRHRARAGLLDGDLNVGARL